ncbi:MAG: NYN domain-containing protein [Coriobacteriales bacterium]|jgi:uncharacterized protein (TIGR00288 family)
MDSRKRFALLIDSDNISAKYIDPIINEITTKYGDFSYKRIYGDWTSQQNSSWKQVLLTYSLKPVQQFRNTVGKNATDSTLIIDAMDILYTGYVDGFCIVSSDSDFTSLAQRLGEAGKTVIGMGEQKTPTAFRNACTQFIMLENLLDSDEEFNQHGQQDRQDENSQTLSLDAVRETIEEILRDNESRGMKTNLADLGNRLVSRYPEFDVRAFGYTKLSMFLKSFDAFELYPQDAPIEISLKKADTSSHDVLDFIREEVDKTGDDGIGLAFLGQEIKKEFPNFSFKDNGYSKLSNFLEDVPGVEIHTDPDGVGRVYASR